MSRKVVIASYNPQWPALYEAEKERILGAIGQVVVAIEHVGSTAVPGLGAKPIIDIMAGVRELAAAEACIPRLEGIGYEYVPEYEVAMPERRYFRKGVKHGRTHHLHMVESTSTFWERHLLFRDYLRAHPETARQYQAEKRRFAKVVDKMDYTEAKTPFIEDVLAKAYAARNAELTADS